MSSHVWIYHVLESSLFGASQYRPRLLLVAFMQSVGSHVMRWSLESDSTPSSPVGIRFQKQCRVVESDSIFYFPIPWRAAGGWQMRTPEEPTLRNAVEGVYEPQMSLESILEIFWPSSAGRGRRRDLSCTQRARIGEIWRLSSLTDVSSLSFVKLEQAIRCALRRSQQRTSLEAQ